MLQKIGLTKNETMKTTRNVYYPSHSVYVVRSIVSNSPPIPHTPTLIKTREGHKLKVRQQLTEVNESSMYGRSITNTSTQGALISGQPLKTLYTQTMTTSECVDVGDLL
jgi:hypothetical protein